MNYVSCSPYRVPIARLAAAQAAISGGDKTEACGPRNRAVEHCGAGLSACNHGLLVQLWQSR